MPGTDTNGVGVAGGLNENAGVDPTSSRAEARLSGVGPVEQLRELITGMMMLPTLQSHHWVCHDDLCVTDGGRAGPAAAGATAPGLWAWGGLLLAAA